MREEYNAGGGSLLAKKLPPFRNLNWRGGSLPLPPLVSVDSFNSLRPKGRSCHWQAGRFAPPPKKADWVKTSIKKTACFSTNKTACFPVTFSFIGGETGCFFIIPLAEKQANFLYFHFTPSAFLEGERGNHSLANKEWFPRIISRIIPAFLFTTLPPARRRFFPRRGKRPIR